MSSTTDVLPVLTSRFLEYHEDDHYKQHHQKKLQPPSPWQPPQPINTQDNTCKFLTERWSEGMLAAGLQDLQSPVKSNAHPSFDHLASPMWISPNYTIKSTFSVEALATADSLALPHVPCLAATLRSEDSTTVNEADELGDIPTFVCIPNKAAKESDPVLMAAAVNVATKESSPELDEVSMLADNPDDDDMNLLPHATHDVLANIFDEIYKDESEVEEEDWHELMSK